VTREPDPPPVMSQAHWRTLCWATHKMMTGRPVTDYDCLTADVIYGQWGLQRAVPIVCAELGIKQGRKKNVLLLALAGISPAEIRSAHATGTLPDERTLRTLLTLRGFAIPAVKPNRPKRHTTA
jgi:hypothetical protein